MTGCPNATAARAMLRTPGTTAQGTWTFLTISVSGPWPVLMPTCTNAGENFFLNRVPCATILLPRSTMTTTAGRYK
jgi:hypothetical protein